MPSTRPLATRLEAFVAREFRTWLDGLPAWALLWCLGTVAVIVMASGASLILQRSLVGSGAYQDALREVRAHPAAIEALGSPIADGWMRKGSITAQSPGRLARLDIPVSGPRGTGLLHVEAVQGRGAWRMQVLQLALASGARIDLLAGNP